MRARSTTKGVIDNEYECRLNESVPGQELNMYDPV